MFFFKFLRVFFFYIRICGLDGDGSDISESVSFGIFSVGFLWLCGGGFRDFILIFWSIVILVSFIVFFEYCSVGVFFYLL